MRFIMYSSAIDCNAMVRSPPRFDRNMIASSRENPALAAGIKRTPYAEFIICICAYAIRTHSMCVPALQFHYTAKKSKQEAMPVHVFHFRIKCLFLPKAPTVHKYLRTLYRSAMHSQMRTYNAQIIPPCNIIT